MTNDLNQIEEKRNIRSGKGMIRAREIPVLLLLLLIAGYTQAQNVPALVDGTDAVRQMEIESFDALVKGDAAPLERIWAEDYTFTAPNGVVISKVQYIGMLKNKGVMYETVTSDKLKVKIYGDTALVSGNAIVKGKVGDHIIDGVDRYLTVYLRRDGRWQQVSTLSTRLPKS